MSHIYLVTRSSADNIIYLVPAVGQSYQFQLFWFYNYNRPDATIFDYLFLKGSACFGRFLHPPSAAHNCGSSTHRQQHITAVPPPTIGSTKLYIQLHVLSTGTAAGWCCG